MASSDSVFHALPEPLRRLIDDAFTCTANPNYIPTRTSAKSAPIAAPVESSSAGGGGFIAEDAPAEGGRFLVEDEPMGGGGFLVEGSDSAGGGFLAQEPLTEQDEGQPPSQIPFDLVPAALQRLDLPPDDDEILAVFRNAASGWASVSVSPAYPPRRDADGGSALYVSRDDWRSVCAVLLESSVRGEYKEDVPDDSSDAHMDMDAADEEDDDEDGANLSDAYVGPASVASSEQSDISDDDDDEFQLEGTSTRKRRTRQVRNELQGGSNYLIAAKLGKPTRRQRQTALDAFTLFFAETAVPPDELPNQKLKLSDIQHAAKLIGEKIKADEMLDMLDVFSTSADKSMNLEDFTCMMITAKLA